MTVTDPTLFIKDDGAVVELVETAVEWRFDEPVWESMDPDEEE